MVKNRLRINFQFESNDSEMRQHPHLPRSMNHLRPKPMLVATAANHLRICSSVASPFNARRAMTDNEN
jgi:hypothetical protein